MDNKVINDIVEELKELRQEIKELKAELYELKESKKIKVGDKVRYTSDRYLCFRNKIGIVIDADESKMPYCIKFDNNETLWAFKSDVELV